MPTLEDAILLALQAHRGQVDKAGDPYILHLFRVMMKQDTDMTRIVAVLHDLVEDTRYTLKDLEAMGYSTEVLAALDCVTRRDGESYDTFIERAQPNAIARHVKLADLEDNMDITRLNIIREQDLERLRRYRQTWANLKNHSD